MSKTIKIGGRIESAEQGGVVTGANDIFDDTKGKKQDVINSETDDELARLDSTKQDVLTFDNAPTEGSNNPVKSGGVYAADAALQQAIEAILLLIPSAASALNQLADKAFVNSTVATDSATFRGTYNVVTDLSLHYDATHQQIATALLSKIQTADNNDYSFVQIPVSDSSDDIRVTERYKFNGTAWAYEYDLNNSGFTAAQWDAINSGITAALVGDLNDIKSYIPAEATALNKLADMAYVLAKIIANIPAFKGQFTTLSELQTVQSPKSGDYGIVRTKDNDGQDVFTFYQYLNGSWNVYYLLSRHPQRKPVSTGVNGDYPFNGMGLIELPMNMREGWMNDTWLYYPVNGIVYLLYSWNFQLYAVYSNDEGLGLENNVVVKPANYNISDIADIVSNRYLSFTEDGGVYTITKPDSSTITSTELNNTTIINYNDPSYKGVNVLTQDMMSAANTKYVIKYDYVLSEDITIPANCVLEFDGGSISDGTINFASNDTTLIKFNSPFIGNNIHFVIDTDIDTVEDDHGGEDTINTTKVSPYTFDKEIFRESEIFKTVEHSQEQLEIMINASMPGKKIITDTATYIIDTIKITRDIDIDFSGSTLIARTYDPDSSWHYCSARAFYMKKWVTTGIKTIRIKNAVIDGYRWHNDDSYQFRRIVQIFNVDNVIFDNVKFQNFYGGNNAQYTENINRRYELANVSIMNVLYCSITNCGMTDFTNGEGFWVCPKKDTANYTIFSGNKAGNNTEEPDSYIDGSILTVIDGRCLVENNTVSNYKNSAFNLFCYNSIIRNNVIKNSQRSAAIDLTEGGIFVSHNVEIYGNVCDNIKGFVKLSGSKFYINNNTITNPDNVDTSKNNKGAFVEIHNYDTSSYDNYVDTQTNLKHYTSISYPKDIFIEDNSAEMQYLILSSTSSYFRYNVNIVNNKFKTIPVLTSGNNWGQPLRFFKFDGICIKNNVFDDTYNYSTATGKRYFQLTNCAGSVIIQDNRFKYKGDELNVAACTILFTSSTAVVLDMQNNISAQKVTLLSTDSISSEGISILSNNINMYNTNPVGNNVIRPNNLTEFTGDNSKIVSLVYADSYIIDNGVKKIPTAEGWVKVTRSMAGSYFMKDGGYTYSDNSVWLCLNTGQHAATEPDITGKVIGDIITDGNVQMKKVADSFITFT